MKITIKNVSATHELWIDVKRKNKKLEGVYFLKSFGSTKIVKTITLDLLDEDIIEIRGSCEEDGEED